ncbi:MAG: Maf family protein, partial [Thermoleophilaceae bacterium]
MIPEALARPGRLVLASRSPQRRAILAMLGIEFEVVEPAYDEPDLEGSPGD